VSSQSSAQDPSPIKTSTQALLDKINALKAKNPVLTPLAKPLIPSVSPTVIAAPQVPASQRVYFYVQKSQGTTSNSVPLTFDNTVTNIGNAMDAASGVFTAPVAGVYFFSFSGISTPGTDLRVQFLLNGALVGTAISHTDYSTAAMESTLSLKAGDKITLSTAASGATGALLDTSLHYTHFNGFLLP